jgi:hypothetical protein
MQPKGGYSAGKWEDRFEWDAVKLRRFPLPEISSEALAQKIAILARNMSQYDPLSLLQEVSKDKDCDIESTLKRSGCERVLTVSRLVAFQEELDWRCYRFYGLTEPSEGLEWPEDRLNELPPLNLGERAFEIVMARQMQKGELETTWFERHKHAGSKPTTDLPDRWPKDYTDLVCRRIKAIEKKKSINLIERPEYKRRWNVEPWETRQTDALRRWLLARLEGYFFEGNRVCELKTGFDSASRGFAAAARPYLVSTNQLAELVQSDQMFLKAAEVYKGMVGFSIANFVRELVENESVPNLPINRYKDSGLRARMDWEATWELQRSEDAVEAKVRQQHVGRAEDQLKGLIAKAQQDQVGKVTVPPKYASADFQRSTFWKLRGKLDVPKERWISYPGAERDGDPSPLIAWAGWDHLQQAQALAEYYLDAKSNQGWPERKLKILLAGLLDLLPWLKHWHNEMDPDYGMGLGDYFEGFLDEECRALGLTIDEVNKARYSSAPDT